MSAVSTALSFFTVASTVAILLLSYLFVQWSTSPLHSMPRAPGKARPWDFLFGHVLTILRDESFLDSPIRWWKEALKTKKNVPFLAATTVFGKWIVIILDVDILKQILSEPEKQHPIRFPKRLMLLQQVLGDSLSSLEGPDWHRHRKILQPSFQGRHLKTILSESVPRRTKQLLRAWKQAGSSRRIDLASHMSALTLDIFGDVSFLHDFGALKLVESWVTSPDSNLGPMSDPLIQALTVALKPKLIDMVLAILNIVWLDKYLSPQTVRVRHQLLKAINDIISKVQNNTNTRDYKCLLQLLIDAKDGNGSESLNDAELRAEANQFMVIGYETTATWCYFTLILLAKHRNAQEKVFNELKNLDDSSMSDLETIESLPYFNACLQEALRLYPPNSAMVRKTTRTEHFKGYTIPPGTRLVIPIFMLHRHPDHWRDPEAFIPERWLDDLEGKRRNRFAFLPFGAGSRSCIGQRFAQIEAKLLLVPLLKQFRITLAPGMPDKVNITMSSIVKTKPALYVCAHERT